MLQVPPAIGPQSCFEHTLRTCQLKEYCPPVDSTPKTMHHHCTSQKQLRRAISLAVSARRCARAYKRSHSPWRTTPMVSLCTSLLPLVLVPADISVWPWSLCTLQMIPVVVSAAGSVSVCHFATNVAAAIPAIVFDGGFCHRMSFHHQSWC